MRNLLLTAIFFFATGISPIVNAETYKGFQDRLGQNDKKSDAILQILSFEGVVTESNVEDIKTGRTVHGRAVWEVGLVDMDSSPTSGLYMNLRKIRTSTSLILRGSSDVFVNSTAPVSDDVHFDATDTAPAVWWGPGDEPGDWIIIICESNSPENGGDKFSFVYGGVSETHGVIFMRAEFADPSGQAIQEDALPDEFNVEKFKTATFEIADHSGKMMVKGEVKGVDLGR